MPNPPKPTKSQKAQARAERAAELIRQQQAAERRRNLLVVAGVVVAMVLIVGVLFFVNASRDSADDIDAAPAGQSDFGLTIGDSGAPHDVVIYEDFLCPFCGQLERESSDQLDKLAKEGKVQVEYRPFNLLQTDYSVAAANAFAVLLDKEGPEVAKKFHDLIYADQPSESGEQPGADWLLEKAVDAGADEAAVKPGIEGLTEKDWVEDATKAAADAGVSSTPTILLDGKAYQDGRTIEEIADNLVAELE
ncbi:thioredoxin domain-containing protein [Nocardioides sp. 503]|uniref:DsbA family protein n=1 Tax=Nocardioides sp. 503 TaxID=2508326 RepID=UPI001FD6EBCA|nr:thioredoxin domain-containing protein [Nocardioides sp. 503]